MNVWDVSVQLIVCMYVSALKERRDLHTEKGGNLHTQWMRGGLPTEREGENLHTQWERERRFIYIMRVRWT